MKFADLDLHFTPRTPEEEIAAALKAKTGDELAVEAFLSHYYALAMKLAKGVARGRLPEDEIISAGTYGLMRAFQAYDPCKGHFACYMRPFILREISLAFKMRCPVSMSDDYWLRRKYPAEARACNPRLKEAGEDCISLVEQGLVWSHEGAGSYEERDLLEARCGRVVEGMKQLPEGRREFLRLHFGGGLSYDKIAAQRGPGCNGMFVWREIQAALKQLRKIFNGYPELV